MKVYKNGGSSSRTEAAFRAGYCHTVCCKVNSMQLYTSNSSVHSCYVNTPCCMFNSANSVHLSANMVALHF